MEAMTLEPSEIEDLSAFVWVLGGYVAAYVLPNLHLIGA